MKTRGFPDRSSVRSHAMRAAAMLCISLSFASTAFAQPDSEVSAALSSVTATPASGALADGHEEVTIELIVRDAQGNPLAEQAVLVSSSNPADMIAQPVAPTDAQGRAIASMVTEVEGSRVLWATVDPDGDEVELDEQPLVHFEAPPVRPNVIVILIDDVGTDSLSMFDEVNPYQAPLPYMHGTIDPTSDDPFTEHLYALTPNLQDLADNGVTFLNAYAMPICSPTRACLLTGNYPVRTGVGAICHFGTTGALAELGDSGYESATLPQLATGANYADILVGKWHLGQPTSDMYPDGSMSAPPSWTQFLGWSTIPSRGHFMEWISVFGNVTTPRPLPPETRSGIYTYCLCHNPTTNHADVPVIDNQYVTTVLFEEARNWCTLQTRPFLCVITPTSAHSPWGELPPQIQPSTDEYWQQDPPNAWQGYMAQVETIDTEIGHLLSGLTPTVRQNTLLIVMGDNGIENVCLEHARIDGPTDPMLPPGPTNPEGSDKDLGQTYDFLLDSSHDRFKGSTYEKGIRVPMIVSGFGVVDPGRVTNALVDVTDVFPTVAELLGQPLPGPVHGVSFLPVLAGSVGYSDHERDFTYAEFFSPLGATVPSLATHRYVGCSLIIPGQGRYKIVFSGDWIEGEDEFYKLQDANGAFVDPFETVNLDHDVGDAEYGNYTLVKAKMEEIVASGAGAGPQDCTTATNFCSSEPNSTGQPAVISGSGPCSVFLNQYVLHAGPVPNQFGIFFYGDGMVNMGGGLPFGNGLRCVKGATSGGGPFRLRIVHAAGSGPEFTLDDTLDFTDVPAPIHPNSTWNFQAWFRDPSGGGDLFDLSDAMTVTFGS